MLAVKFQDVDYNQIATNKGVAHLESGLGVAEAGLQMGVSRQTASKWRPRERRSDCLADRSSRHLRPACPTQRRVQRAAGGGAGMRHIFTCSYSPG